MIQFDEISHICSDGLVQPPTSFPYPTSEKNHPPPFPRPLNPPFPVVFWDPPRSNRFESVEAIWLRTLARKATFASHGCSTKWWMRIDGMLYVCLKEVCSSTVHCWLFVYVIYHNIYIYAVYIYRYVFIYRYRL